MEIVSKLKQDLEICVFASEGEIYHLCYLANIHETYDIDRRACLINNVIANAEVQLSKYGNYSKQLNDTRIKYINKLDYHGDMGNLVLEMVTRYIVTKNTNAEEISTLHKVSKHMNKLIPTLKPAMAKVRLSRTLNIHSYRDLYLSDGKIYESYHYNNGIDFPKDCMDEITDPDTLEYIKTSTKLFNSRKDQRKALRIIKKYFYTSSFVRSLYKQILNGRTPSDKQLAALIKIDGPNRYVKNNRIIDTGNALDNL
jgi:hypothetical protein